MERLSTVLAISMATLFGITLGAILPPGQMSPDLASFMFLPFFGITTIVFVAVSFGACRKERELAVRDGCLPD